jgi:hypothetical protein
MCRSRADSVQVVENDEGLCRVGGGGAAVREGAFVWAGNLGVSQH